MPAEREVDLECAVGDRPRLANQLIEPLLGHHSVAFSIDVEPMRIAGRFAVDEHLERHGRTSLPWSQDEMHVAGMEAERDASAGLVQHAGPALDRPITGESPVVEPQRIWRDIRSRLVERDTTWRREVLSLLVAEVRLGRRQVRPIGLSLETGGGDGQQSVS